MGGMLLARGDWPAFLAGREWGLQQRSCQPQRRKLRRPAGLLI